MPLPKNRLGGGGIGGRGGRPQRKKTFKTNVKGERNTKRHKKGGGKGSNTFTKFVCAFVATAFVSCAFIFQKEEKKKKQEEEQVRQRLRSKPMSITEHGACRMDCRFVSKKDIKDALREGRLSKRHLSFDQQKFAFEKGRVRAIFAENEENETVSVVTVIDVETDHPCGPC